LAFYCAAVGCLQRVLPGGRLANRAVVFYSQANMRVFNNGRRFQSSWVSWLGIVCIALVLLTGIIQVAHTHPDGQVDHEGCSLCNTAHHVVQTVALVTLAISIRPVLRVTLEKTPECPRQKFLLKLAIRPPPVSPTAA
jgi:hypothetical protein